MRLTWLIAVARIGALGFACLCGLSSFGAPPRNGTQPIVASEYSIKAAFLLNFARFIEWPRGSFAGEDAPLVVAILGEDPFGEVMDRTLQAKTVNTHPLLLKRLRFGDDLSTCHIVFVSRSEKDKVPAIVRSLQGRSVLLVSETEQFLEQGGIINFYLEADNVKFSINLSAAEHSGLKISSKLLRLAKIFKAGPPSE